MVRGDVEPATTLIANEANGYPYFLQEYGRAAWDVAAGPTITYSDVLIAITDGREPLDAGFFHSRWARATPAERQYLSAMTQDGLGPSLSSEIASRLGRTIQSLGPTRANLIAKASSTPPNTARSPTPFPAWPTS
jgi:hypothetical protein